MKNKKRTNRGYQFGDYPDQMSGQGITRDQAKILEEAERLSKQTKHAPETKPKNSTMPNTSRDARDKQDELADLRRKLHAAEGRVQLMTQYQDEWSRMKEKERRRFGNLLNYSHHRKHGLCDEYGMPTTPRKT